MELRRGTTRARHGAMRTVAWIGAAALAATAATAAEPPGSAAPAVTLAADTTALVLCGTTCPTPDATYIEVVGDQYIAPTHPGQEVAYVPVTAPMEMWPITGVLRIVVFAVGDRRFGMPGGPAWPDEPLWQLSGLFDLTADQSVAAGVAALERSMADHDGERLVIFGYSQGAFVANQEKRRLAAQYPVGTAAPDISFVLIGDPSVPNGGLNSRFPGVPTVIMGTFNGPESTDTQFHTDVITRQYDGAADFPLYPLNLVADVNAVMGFLYLHTNYFDVSLRDDPTASPAYQGTHGDSSYYFFPTEQLPLFAPLRQMGVPEQLIGLVEPATRVIVELGYDRTVPPWEPTPARLIPDLDPAKTITDLVGAIGEGVGNATAPASGPDIAGPPATVSAAPPTTVSATPPATGDDPAATSDPSTTSGATPATILGAIGTAIEDVIDSPFERGRGGTEESPEPGTSGAGTTPPSGESSTG